MFSHTTPRALAEMFGAESAPSASTALEDLSKYDYSAIGQVLSGNTFEAFLDWETQPLGNILLTGATGFLGIHVLREFLESESGKAYCLMRKGRYSSVEKRLKSLLFYYFENTYEELLGDRLFVVEGDVTDAKVFDRLAQDGLDVQTVINCAANVKHFSADTDIEDVNVGGVLHAIDFCEKTGSRLIHVSTTSVLRVLRFCGENGLFARCPNLRAAKRKAYGDKKAVHLKCQMHGGAFASGKSAFRFSPQIPEGLRLDNVEAGVKLRQMAGEHADDVLIALDGFDVGLDERLIVQGDAQNAGAVGADGGVALGGDNIYRCRQAGHCVTKAQALFI